VETKIKAKQGGETTAVPHAASGSTVRDKTSTIKKRKWVESSIRDEGTRSGVATWQGKEGVENGRRVNKLKVSRHGSHEHVRGSGMLGTWKSK
jgi:hypothetical protein